MARFTLPRDLYHGKGSLEALKTLTDQEIMHVYARNSAYDFQVPSDARKFFEFFTRWIQGAIREA